MRFEEPELLVGLAADLGEEIGRVGVSEAGGFIVKYFSLASSEPSR